MARLKVSNGQPVSLFPMFNILVCTLGCLILIVGTVVAFSLGPGRSVLIDIEETIGGKHHKTPTYIEWDGKGITIHPERNSVPLDLSVIQFSDEEFEEIKNSLGDNYSDEQLISAVRRRRSGKIMGQIEQTLFEDLLQRIHREKDSEYLVIMVRPSGFDTFVALRNFILEQGLDVGYEPIDQNWNLRVR